MSEATVHITDLQRSYLVGRGMRHSLGGVACHAYLEVSGGEVDATRLGSAWARLMSRHALTRAKVADDGTVSLADGPGANSFWSFDLRDVSEDEATALMADCRLNLSHRRMDLSRGQGFGLVLFTLPGRRSRMCFDVDLSICDVNGFQELLNELAALYADPRLEGSVLVWDGRARASGVPRSVEVPSLMGPFGYGANAAALSGCRYRSLDALLELGRLGELRRRFEGDGSDLFCGLLACLLKSADFASDEDVVVNVPWFEGTAPGKDFVRDTTRVVWLTVGGIAHKGLPELARELGHELSQQLLTGHPTRYSCADGLVPLVYSFNQNGIFLDEGFRESFGELSHMISQTPNVCLDVQLFQMTDGLLTSWVFPQEMRGFEAISRWFGRFMQLVGSI